ncbi:MFS transporter [Haloechinothrix alba]|nr:MFS transporter [Haloechinothrix alba]
MATRARVPGVPTRSRSWVLLVAVVLVALNLRGPIAAVAPVLGDVRGSIGIGGTAGSLLTTLPVLCFALAAPLVPALSARSGPDRAVLLGLAGIAAGTVLRSVDGFAAALAGTALIGLAITIGNVLVPVVVKRDFASAVGPVMGAYTAALASGAALTAALTAPLAQALGGWRAALACWAALAVLAALAWMLAVPGRAASHEPAASTPPSRVWRSGIAWAVALFLGAQSGLYYAVTAWLPTLLADRAGYTAGAGGVAMALFQIVGVASTLAVPTLATRARDQRGLAVLVAALWTVTLGGLLGAPGMAVLWTVTGGLAQGAGIALAFTLIVLRVHGLDTARHLSGMVQAVGYSLGAAGPLLAGALHDATGGWSAPLVLLLGAAGALAAAGAVAGRGTTIDR